MTNTSPFQSILVVIGGVLGILTTALIGFGCTATAGVYSCALSTAPTWLVPWLTMGATVATVGAALVKAFSSGGGLFNKTDVPTEKLNAMHAELKRFQMKKGR